MAIESEGGVPVGVMPCLHVLGTNLFRDAIHFWLHYWYRHLDKYTNSVEK